LHYGHAGEPNNRHIRDDDICLFDLGAEYLCYGSDITCSFPIRGKFTKRQEGIYLGVLQAQLAVYQILKPGVSYRDCHKAAEAAILKQLTNIGIVTPGDKSIEELVEMRLGAVFLPCGLGHLIGIDTHDVGGYLPGHPERIDLPGLRKLRTARRLEENMTLTVEPGIYFIDHLLDGALEDGSPLKSYLNEELVNSYRGFGGVRLEDVVAITKDGFINYTLCPRTIEEVEHVMGGGKWPPLKDEMPELKRERLTDPNPIQLPAPPSK
jgi:Xaa-Pro dipeptidase